MPQNKKIGTGPKIQTYPEDEIAEVRTVSLSRYCFPVHVINYYRQTNVNFSQKIKIRRLFTEE